MARRATKLDEDADFRSPAQNRERQRADAAEQVACSTFSGERSPCAMNQTIRV